MYYTSCRHIVHMEMYAERPASKWLRHWTAFCVFAIAGLTCVRAYVRAVVPASFQLACPRKLSNEKIRTTQKFPLPISAASILFIDRRPIKRVEPRTCNTKRRTTMFTGTHSLTQSGSALLAWCACECACVWIPNKWWNLPPIHMENLSSGGYLVC